MFASSWLRQLQRRWFGRRTIRRVPVPRVRLCLEVLEDRTVPAPISTTGDLITAIQNANAAGGATTITLAPNTTFDFTAASDRSNGANALPAIKGNITIVGNNDTIERTGSSLFRLFDVAGGGSLTLENLTLTGGLAQGAGAAAEGGAVYSAGILTLRDVTVQGNKAQGSGGAKGTAVNPNGGAGANASGGGLYVAGGGVTLTNDTFSDNIAQGGTGGGGGMGSFGAAGGIGGNGGNGGTGGRGMGGAVDVATGALTLTNDTFSGNNAQGGSGGSGGSGGTGGIGSGINPGHNGNPGRGGTGGTGTGGGMDVAGGTLAMANTLIAENNATPGTGGVSGGSNGSASAPDVSGTVVSSDHDLIGNDSGFTATTSTGDILNPSFVGLGSLANNGGPTQTMALLPGSPAIDAGDSNAPVLDTDQRGLARIVGNAIDIGAVEYQYDLAVSGTTSSAVVPGQTITYQISVTNNGPDTADGVVLTDVLPSGVTFVSLQSPAGWTTQTPQVGQNGTVTVTTATLTSGASADFTLVVQTSNSTPASLANTVTIGPSTWDTDTNNNSVAFTTAIQYQPTISVSDGGTYNGSPFSATGTALEVDGKTPVPGTFSYVYYAGNSASSGTPLSGPPSDAGTYTVVATFTSSDPNYASGGTAQTTFTISPATPTVTVYNPGGPYLGIHYASSGTAVGVDGNTVYGGFDNTFYAGSSTSGTPLPDAPTNVGTYTELVTFTSSDPNYASGGTAQTTFTITPATPTVTVYDPGGTFTGNAFPAIATAVGIDGFNIAFPPVAGSFTFTYYSGSTASGTPLSGAPSAAGTYTVVANFTSSDPNYTNTIGQTTFTINPASPTSTSGNPPPAGTGTQGITPTAGLSSNSAGLLGFAFEEFELTMYSLWSLVFQANHLPDASLQTTIASLQTAVHNDPLASTVEGQLAILLSQIAAWNLLDGQ